jgi:acetyltransferase-like isoleucine patch superfamily enzyme
MGGTDQERRGASAADLPRGPTLRAMIRLTELQAYSDENGNVVEYSGRIEQGVKIKFTGSNNRLIVADDARIGSLTVDFDCDNGTLEIGGSKGVPAFSAAIRIGQDATVTIGRNVSTTSTAAFSAVEGVTITVGNDVMFASENQVRADDGHPIFDVRTGQRVNVARDITIGDHVWLGRFSTVLGGVTIGEGSVIGYASVVTRDVPNNCVAAGSPAKVVRRDIAWERPHLSLVKPYYKPDASTVKKSKYWNLTRDASDTEAPRRRGFRRRAR